MVTTTGEGEEVDEKEDKGDMSMSRKKTPPMFGQTVPYGGGDACDRVG